MPSVSSGRTRVRVSKTAIFSALFFLHGAAQTILLTVLPLETLRLMGDPWTVSVVYAAVGVAGFFGRLAIPTLTRMIRRIGVLELGLGMLAVAGLLLWSETRAGLVVGLVLNVFAIACMEIVLNLYVLDHIARHDLGRFEARRIFFSALPWTIGPWLGVYLQVALAKWIPFAIAVGAAGLLLFGLKWAGLAEAPVSAHVRRRSLNPALYLFRFFAQPRLRLAWFLAAGRSSWWGIFQVYAPIYAIQSGLGGEVGGAIVSIGIGWMWFVPFWGWLGRRYGLRRLLVWGYALGGLSTIGAALVMGSAVLGATALLVAAFAVESIDGAGNSLYLRAVHPFERSEMTAVFVSYRDASQFVPPAVCSALLAAFDLPAVFVAGGIMMLGMAGLSRYIPKRF